MGSVEVTKYNQKTKKDEPYKRVESDQAIPTMTLYHSSIKIEESTQISHKLDATIIKYFTELLDDEIRAKSVVQKLTIELSEDEITMLAKQLKSTRKKIKTPANYDVVTSEVVIKIEEFILFITAKDMQSIEHLKEENIDIYRELREAFVKGKVLKSGLKNYFFALYGVSLSAKTMLAQLRVIDPVMFGDKNIKNKKKDSASYLLA